METLAEGLARPMQMEFGEDGSLYFVVASGDFCRLDPTSGKLHKFGSIGGNNLHPDGSVGLLGMALDPGFGCCNRWVYFYHMVRSGGGRVLCRYTLSGNKIDMSTRRELLQIPMDGGRGANQSGTIRFGPGGLLYLSIGDDTIPGGSDGYSPLDARAGFAQADAGRTSANTNDLRGKILRIQPTRAGGYRIPTGNMYPKGTENTRPEIYAIGFRNPWQFSVDPKTGWLYVGDTGPEAGKDSKGRGPRGYDTLCQVRRAGNFGWPFVRGHSAYHQYDFSNGKPGQPFSKYAPVNKSPNNTGLPVLPPVVPPLVWYPDANSEDFPLLGTGRRMAGSGIAFHFEEKFKDTGGFPRYFDKAVLFYDRERPALVWVKLDGQGRYIGMETFPGVLGVGKDKDLPGSRPRPWAFSPADMAFGPDGALYILDSGSKGEANGAKILRMSYKWK